MGAFEDPEGSATQVRYFRSYASISASSFSSIGRWKYVLAIKNYERETGAETHEKNIPVENAYENMVTRRKPGNQAQSWYR